MMPFSEIWESALVAVGGARELERQLPVPKSDAELKAIDDARYLSLMSLRIFRAGLKHAIVDSKWPAFEDAFFGFEPNRVAFLNDEELDQRAGDPRLIRHGPKMQAVRANAAALVETSREFGGFGAYLAAWPPERTVALWGDLGKRFRQLGGNSAANFLRMCGKDTFILTPDVANGLVAAGAVDRAPKSKSDLAAVQRAFDAWREESARPLCQVSKALALYASTR